MKESSKVIMGATVVMVVSLAIVLGLVLVLLAELYCSLLLRRRLLKPTTAANAGATMRPTLTTGVNCAQLQSIRSVVSSFFDKRGGVRGVFRAPTTRLAATSSPKLGKQETRVQEDCGGDDLEAAQRGKLGQLLSFQRTGSGGGSAQHPTSVVADATEHDSTRSYACGPSLLGGGGVPPPPTRLVSSNTETYYISNPIYDNNDVTNNPGGPHDEEVGNPDDDEETPPFETPDSSPSQLEIITGGGGGSSECAESDDEREVMSSRRSLPSNLLKEIQSKAMSRRRRMMVVAAAATSTEESGDSEVNSSSENAASYSFTSTSYTRGGSSC